MVRTLLVRQSQAHCDTTFRFGGHRVELRQDDLESAAMDAPTFPLNQIHEFGDQFSKLLSFDSTWEKCSASSTLLNPIKLPTDSAGNA